MENHKIFDNGENLFIIELDAVYEYNTEGKRVSTYNTRNKNHTSEHWLAGPPVYSGSKAYFAGNCSEKTDLYCFDFDNPRQGLTISQPKCFEVTN